MPKFKTLTIVLALVVGATGGAVLRPRWQLHRALLAIAGADPAARGRGWEWLLAPGRERGTRRVDRRRADVGARLAAAGDDALLDGAEALQTCGLWGWRWQRADLVLREITLRAASPDRRTAHAAAHALVDAPLDAAPALVRRAVDALLAHPDPSVRAEAFGAACGWAGRDRGPWIAALAVPAGDAHLQDMRGLALFWCPPDRGPPALDPTPADGAPADLLPALLARGPADDDGAVYAAALLAERRLPPDEARRLAERWIRSFDDDEKRAGALLAALLGAHAALLERAAALEDVGRVRTAQRLARWVLGTAGTGPDPREIAHRARGGRGGDFDPDTVAYMLLAGEADAIAAITSPPPDPLAAAVRRRVWLIERFLPAWHAAAGRPADGGRPSVQLHFDRLEALRLLTRRRLRFDAASRTYTEITISAGFPGAGPAVPAASPAP